VLVGVLPKLELLVLVAVGLPVLVGELPAALVWAVLGLEVLAREAEALPVLPLVLAVLVGTVADDALLVVVMVVPSAVLLVPAVLAVLEGSATVIEALVIRPAELVGAVGPVVALTVAESLCVVSGLTVVLVSPAELVIALAVPVNSTDVVDVSGVLMAGLPVSVEEESPGPGVVLWSP
jgi:hypothetical protein